MDDTIRRALDRGGIVDITTTGRRTGQPRRIEIALHNFGGRLYISGMPSTRTRAWLHNLRADSRLTVHLRGQGPGGDLPATARVIEDEPERREVLPRVARAWNRSDVEAMVRYSPLIEVEIPGYRAAAAA